MNVDDLVKDARIQLQKGGGILISTGLKLCDRIEELEEMGTAWRVRADIDRKKIEELEAEINDRPGAWVEG